MAQLPRVILYERPLFSQFGALGEGIKAVGWQPVFSRAGHFHASEVDTTAKAVVVYGLRPTGAAIADAYRAKGIPVWVMEAPRIRAEGEAHSLLLDSLHWLPESVSGREFPLPPKQTRKAGAKSILVAMQVPGDAAHGMTLEHVENWTRHTVAFVKAVTGKQVIVRPHPKHRAEIPSDWWGADGLSHPNTEPLDAALRGAVAMVTYNSTAGWEAIIAGVPLVALAPAAVCAYHRYTTTLAELEPLSASARAEAVARVSSTQWTIAELTDGRAVRATLLSYH